MTYTTSHPVTSQQAAVLPVSVALMRYQLLERRDLLSKTAVRVRPQGRRQGGTASEPLTALERLELIALGEHLACHFRDEQRELAKRSPGITTGFSEAEYIKAQAAVACPPCPRCGADEVVWDSNDATSESWHCCACRCDYSTGARS